MSTSTPLQSDQSRNRLRIPGKTVYVLGTGFSKPMGIPVITEFIPEGLRMLKKRVGRDETCRKTLEEMQDVLDKYMPRLRAAEGEERDPTIEDVFCVVDLLGKSDGENCVDGESNDSRIVKNFLRRVCELTEKSVCCYDKAQADSDSFKCPRVDQVHLDSEGELDWGFLFDKASDGGGRDDTVCAYFAFLSQLLGTGMSRGKDKAKSPEWELRAAVDGGAGPDKLADAIVSFNYDLLIERKMAQLYKNSSGTKARIYYGDGVVKDKAPGMDWLCKDTPAGNGLLLPLIKLHGSFNWRESVGGKTCVQVSEEPGTKAASLVWPTWIRENFSGVFDKLLLEARTHLRLASKVVFIGYSMPLTDRYIRYLLADAFATPELPEVIICDYKKKEEEVRCAWERLLGTLAKRIKPTVITDGFVEYVKRWKRPRMTDEDSQ